MNNFQHDNHIYDNYFTKERIKITVVLFYKTLRVIMIQLRGENNFEKH